MQIENNRLKEEMEAAKFELNNHIIQLEYSKGELARDKEKATQISHSAQERLGDVEKERRELADDYIKLKSEFIALTKAHHSEVRWTLNYMFVCLLLTVKVFLPVLFSAISYPLSYPLTIRHP